MLEDEHLVVSLNYLINYIKQFVNSKLPNNMEISKKRYLDDIYTDLTKLKQTIFKENEEEPTNFNTPKKGSKKISKYDSQILKKLRKLENTWDYINKHEKEFDSAKISNRSIVNIININIIRV